MSAMVGVVAVSSPSPFSLGDSSVTGSLPSRIGSTSCALEMS